MLAKVFSNLICVFVVCLAAGAIFYWRTREIDLPQAALAGRDGSQNRIVKVEKAQIGSIFEKNSELSENEKSQNFSDWQNFRGANFLNVVSDSQTLNFDWQNVAPKILYKIPLGQGYSAPAVYKNKFYVLDYDEKSEADMLRCFALSDGRELWRRGYKMEIRRNHGKSRTVVAAGCGAVVSFAPKCQVMCADAESGDLLWGKDLVVEYGSEVPQWYAGQCPIIDSGEVVLVPAGSEVLMMGVDVKTGKENWVLKNDLKLSMSHSSILLTEICGVKQFVYCAIGGVVGVSAEESSRGKLLWFCSDFKPNVFAPSPVNMGNGLVFLTAGYGAGGAVLKVENSNGKWDARILKKWKAKQGIACEQQTPIIFKGKLISILPKDAGANNSLMAAANLDGECKISALSPREQRFGLGPYIVLNGKIVILDDDGILYAMDFDGEKFTQISKFNALDGNDSWGPFAYSSGLLFLRDFENLICLDLRKDGVK